MTVAVCLCNKSFTNCHFDGVMLSEIGKQLGNREENLLPNCCAVTENVQMNPQDPHIHLSVSSKCLTHMFGIIIILLHGTVRSSLIPAISLMLVSVVVMSLNLVH